MRETIKYLKEIVAISNDVALSTKELMEIIKSLESFINPQSESNDLRKHFKDEYSTYSLTIDCLIFWNIAIVQIMLANSPEFRTIEGLTNKGYFTQLWIHLTNNLIGIKYLFENGLDSQVKHIYRNSIELSDLAISVLYDKVFFENHRKPNIKKAGNPFVSPKNNTISKFAEKVIKDVNKELNDSFDTNKVISIFWKRNRHEQYSILSESAHGNYLRNVLNSFKENTNGKYLPSIGGNKWKNLERQLSDICLHQITLKRYITWILKLKHNIDLFDDSYGLHKFIYFLDVVIGKKFLPEIIKPQAYDHMDIV